MAIGEKELCELSMRNSVNFPVGFFGEPSGLKPKLLNNNVTIIILGEFNNLGSDLTASGLDEIGLFVFHSPQGLPCPVRTFVSNAFQFGSPYLKPSLPMGNIPAKIQLLDNFGFPAIKHSSRSKRIRTDVKTDNNRLVCCFSNLLLKDNRYFPISKKRDIGELPVLSEKFAESLKTTISSHGNREGFAFRIGNLETGVLSFGLNEPEPSLVEPDRNSIDVDSIETIPFQNLLKFPSIFPCLLDNIAWQEGGLAYA